ncbi:MAG TPA: hypothetical protein VGQ83_32005 [Polyangia bacterium]|jgi:hypothetical protein
MDDIDLAMDVLTRLTAASLWRLPDDVVLLGTAPSGYWRLHVPELYERARRALAAQPPSAARDALAALFQDLGDLERTTMGGRQLPPVHPSA